MPTTIVRACGIAARLARALLLERQVNFWLGELDPLWSLSEVRARVEAIVQETPDTRSFVLRPNTLWTGHRAGQHTEVSVEIEGVRLRRCYSVSSAPADPLPTITVKRMPSGRVSGWLHEHVRVGDVLRLGPAAGEFVLPEPLPHKLLMLSGGSGVTPVMSMLRDLASRDAIRDLVFVHHARTRADVIFARHLRELSARHRGLRLLLCLDEDRAPGGFDEARLLRLVPDLAEREAFLCGPPGLMERAERAWAQYGATGRLHREFFTPGGGVPGAGAPAAAPVRITLARSGRAFTAASGTLLEQLERAGERPAFGCRRGACLACTCRKRAGAVENLLTGASSNEPDVDIQPCISVARSDLELWL